MGNQMPSRCMVPCNPICCANCFHQDVGREHDTEHKQGSIFANAASVLSMAAEEISLDDHLEKELANEVELWRMETTSTAVHTSDSGYRQVFAPLGPKEGPRGYSADSSSALSSQHDGIESDVDDMTESLGESRGRSSNDFAYSGGRRKVAPGGTREHTGLSTESSSGIRHEFSAPVTESREETATSSLPTAGGVVEPSRTEAGELRHGEENRNGLHDVMMNAGVPEEPSEPKAREGLAAVLPTGGGPGRAVGELSDGDSRTPSTLEARAPVESSSSAGPSSASPRAGPEKGTTRRNTGDVAPRDDTVSSFPTRGDTSGSAARQAALSHDDSFSSSEEDSFPGFIEDPLEKEMQAPGPDDILGYQRPAWSGTVPCHQGVREDRSHF